MGVEPIIRGGAQDKAVKNSVGTVENLHGKNVGEPSPANPGGNATKKGAHKKS